MQIKLLRVRFPRKMHIASRSLHRAGLVATSNKQTYHLIHLSEICLAPETPSQGDLSCLETFPETETSLDKAKNDVLSGEIFDRLA